MTDLFIFSERRKLADAFEKWCFDTGTLLSDESMVAWLAINNLLDIRKCREFLKSQSANKQIQRI